MNVGDKVRVIIGNNGNYYEIQSWCFNAICQKVSEVVRATSVRMSLGKKDTDEDSIHWSVKKESCR